MRLCLVEDLAVAGLEPLTLTRPVYDLRLGAPPWAARSPGRSGSGPGPQRRGAVIRLAPGSRPAPARSAHWSSTTATGWPGARWSWPTAAGCRPSGFEPPEFARPLGGPLRRPARLCAGRPRRRRGARPARDRLLVRRGSPRGPRATRSAASGSTGPGTSSPGTPTTSSATSSTPARTASATATWRPLALVGPSDRLRVHETARIDPYTVFDTTSGPIVVGPERLGAAVHPGRGALLHRPRDPALPRQHPRRASRSARTAGSAARSRPPSSTGYSNKYHEGFLGHAYVGEWVNLGAITSNSDLRNDYGEVFVPLQGRPGGRPARPRSAASSATTPAPAWASCSTRARPSA